MPSRRYNYTDFDRKYFSERWVSIEWSLDRFSVYIETIQAALLQHFTASPEAIHAEAQGLPEEIREDCYDYQAVEASILLNTFQGLTWQTSLVALVSFLEHQMIAVYGDVQRFRALPSLPDRPGIEHVKQHMEKGEVPFPTTEAWNEIGIYRHVRDLLAHQGGQVIYDDRSKRVRAYVTDHAELIKLDSHGRLQLSPAFCLHAIETVRTFFQELQKAVQPALDGREGGAS